MELGKDFDESLNFFVEEFERDADPGIFKPGKDPMLKDVSQYLSTYEYKGKSIIKDGNKVGTRKLKQVRSFMKTATFGHRFGCSSDDVIKHGLNIMEGLSRCHKE